MPHRTRLWPSPLASLPGLALAIVATAGLARGDDPPPSSPVLNLADGGFAPGEPADSADSDRLGWRSPAFVEPFDFSIGSVNAVHWPVPASPPRPTGAYGFELAGGDILHGELAGLDDHEAVIDVPGAGRLHVDRSAIRRIDRWRDRADLIYSGPNGLDGWKTAEPKGAWREESGQPLTTLDGASLRGDFGLPIRAVVEFEISWKAKPDFAFALGVNPSGDDPQSSSRAFRFEVWEGHLVALRETRTEADVAAVQDVPSGSGRAHLQVFLDQEAGRMLVTSSGGEPLADLTVTGPDTKPAPGLQLVNLKGDVRLERLRISRWSGDPPRAARADQARIHLADGSILYGQITGFDAEAKEFLVQGEDGDSRVAEGKISSVVLAAPKNEPERSVRLVNQDGTRLSGGLAKVADGAAWLNVPGIKEPVRLPITGLRSLVVLKHDPAPDQSEGRAGRLEMEGILLRGHLDNDPAKTGTLAWKPDGSATASPLQPGASSRIVYRDPPPPKPRNQQIVRGRVIRVAPAPPVGVAQGFLRALTNAPATTDHPEPGGRRAIHLRTGDIIPAEITRIDESGVWFKALLAEKDFIPHAKIKAVELALPSPTNSVSLTRAKRDRLLTLPRMQKESPPTHLIRAKNGDYLRGRVLSLDDKTLQVEARLETKQVPRDRIARIIWIHPDEIDPTKPTAETDEVAKQATAGPGRVQALRRDGIRLTFVPDSFADETLAGTSELLGAMKVPIRDVDQLLIGRAIESAAAQTAYGPWRLTNAVEPKIATEDGEAHSAGTESALVGNPAPDFKLDLLDGTPFHLAETKGEIVVLDFWATWCGPCLQTMPQIERVTDEFRDKGVRLVAVNLQEGADEIKAMLDRHKLHPTVALDRDGVVADRYAAMAIPQTVIIDREGKVARLFIGGGPRFDETLRTALTEVLEGKPPGPPTDGPIKE